MIITCPSCGRKFNLPDDAIKSPYQKLKCSRCSHVFMLTKEEPIHEEQPSVKVEKQPAKPKPQEVELKPPSASPVVEYEDVSMERPRRRKGIIGIIVTLLL